MKLSTSTTPSTILALLSFWYLPEDSHSFVPSSHSQNPHGLDIQAKDGTSSSVLSQLGTNKIPPRSSLLSTQLSMAVYPVLGDWALATTGGIQGTVVESPYEELEVGEVITTSKIITNRNLIGEGTIVETASGSRYILGAKKVFGGASSARSGRFSSVDSGTSAVSIPTLDDWVLTAEGEITGIVKDYAGDNFVEGEEITTSPLSSRRGIRDGSVVTTTSGSKYRLGKRKPLNVLLQGRFSDAVGGTRPIVEKAESLEEANTSVSSPSNVGASSKPLLFGGLNSFFSTPEKDNVVDDVVEAMKEEEVLKDDKSREKKRPAPFGSVGKGISKGAGRDTSSSTVEEAVPVLENWFVNKRDQVIGIVSNSPYANEPDGKRIVTSEVATNMAFVEEGFTVLTVDDKKYKLGVPKGGSKKNYEDEMATYVTPTLLDWDVDSNLKITGTIQGSNNRNVPDGTSITTDQVISDFEFIDEGFTICTESGMMYKLGNRKRGRKPEAAAPFELPKIALPEVSVPKISVPEFNLGGGGSGSTSRDNNSSNKKEKEEPVSSVGGTMTVSGKIATTPKKAGQPSFFRLAGNKKPRPSPKVSSGTVKTSSSSSSSSKRVSVVIPTLDNWTVNDRNDQVTGIITNSIDRDGEVLTTSELTKKVGLREGATIYTKSGSAYILGKRQRSTAGRSTQRTPSTSSSDVEVIPILNEWAVTAVGGLSGVVVNSPDPDVEDGEILTTSKLENDVSTLAPGDRVTTINGSKYILGSRRPTGAQVESPQTPVLAGIWVMALLIFVALTD